jgi:hypothetical protein
MAEADNKDEGKKESDAARSEKLYQHLAEIAAIIFVLFLLQRGFHFVQRVIENRGYVTESDQINSVLNSLYYFFISSTLFFVIISNVISVLFLMGIIYSVIRYSEIYKEQKSRLYPQVQPAGGPVTARYVNENWERIQSHINSPNPSDWRLAILEADIALDEILNKIGVPGDTIGDKLKNVERSDFTTIDSAWEAHRIRNRIAHEGADFDLNEREARRVIALYEQVFREFHYI